MPATFHQVQNIHSAIRELSSAQMSAALKAGERDYRAGQQTDRSEISDAELESESAAFICGFWDNFYAREEEEDFDHPDYDFEFDRFDTEPDLSWERGE